MFLPLLVTGLAGVAGWNAFRGLRARHGAGVVGLRQRDARHVAGDGIEACDLEDPRGLERIFSKYGFESVLNCAGNCALRACELDPAMAWRVNVEGVQNLLDRLEAARAVRGGRPVRLVHLSVDLVFSGAPGTGGYREEDPPDPVTVYGKTMVAAERLVLERAPGACILRISLPMGPSPNRHAGAIDWILSRFRAGRPATLYFDEVRTPTYVECMTDLFEAVLARPDLAGIFHAGGPRRLSLYEIAQIINRVGGYDPALLQGIPRREAGPVPPRAGNVALESRKLRAALGYEPFDPWPLDEGLVPAGRDWHRKRARGEAGSLELVARVLYRAGRAGG